MNLRFDHYDLNPIAQATLKTTGLMKMPQTTEGTGGVESTDL
jgi:hypothetical protein